MVEAILSGNKNEPATCWGDDVGGEKQKKNAQALNDWCKKVGIESPFIEYPGEFENGLIGIKAKSQI